MSNFNNRSPWTTSSHTQQAVDMGLRAFMIQVYNYMFLALMLTGIVAYGASSPNLFGPTFLPLLMGPSAFKYVILFAPLAVVLFLSFGINRMSFQTAQITFWGYAALVGLSMASIFVIYPVANIAKAFFITASMFGAMSIYGYTTQKDLSAMGSFLMMGVIGLIIASVVNIFTRSAGFDYIISFLAVIIFTGLTAYDTQMIKSAYYEGDALSSAGKKAIMGALMLYLDFINIFLNLLRLLSDRKE